MYLCQVQNKHEKRNPISKDSRHYRLANKTGIWKAGEKLPSLRTISNEYGVSLNTAIQVYYELEKEGFIISRPKSGYIVNYKPLNLSAPATTQPSAQSPGKEEADLIMEVYHSIEDSSITRFRWEYRKMFYCLLPNSIKN